MAKISGKSGITYGKNMEHNIWQNLLNGISEIIVILKTTAKWEDKIYRSNDRLKNALLSSIFLAQIIFN